jgi:uncharacterized DUF497 family protein
VLEGLPPGFAWDPRKAAQNVSKHGVTFDEATTVFDDPALHVRPDDVHSWGEDRLIATGLSAAGRLLTVSYTMRGEVTRLISAWPATPNAVRRYSQGNDD